MKPSANPKRTLIESLQVGLAWDSQIKEWAERKLPNGEVVGRVKNAQTVNYKTLKPVKDGLFCEKIFGPIKDFECACGFKQTRGGFCPQCNVEFTRSEVRRYRLGYFQLPSAVTHVWYLRGRPSYISYLLGIKIKKALALTYGAASLLINSQNERVISQEENESLTFSFTVQTLYAVGECKGKTVPRSQIRRYNPNHFLFDVKRTKLLKNFFHNFVYTPRPKILPNQKQNFASQEGVNILQSKMSHDFLSKFILTEKTSLQNFDKDKIDSIFWSYKNKDLKTFLHGVESTIAGGHEIDLQSKSKESTIGASDVFAALPMPSLGEQKQNLSAVNSYITKPFFFSSVIRGGWQPLIVVNLQDKLPVNLSYKKAHPKYYKFKKYLKLSQNIGFYTPPVFDVPTEGKIKNKVPNESKQKQEENLSSVKINRLNQTFAVGNIKREINLQSKFKKSTAKKVFFVGHEKRTKSFSKKLILSNKKNKVKKILIGIDKEKELSLSTLIFYPIKKEISKLQEQKNLTKRSSQLTKKFYQELDSKFKSLNFVEKATKQIGFSPISEKETNLQEEHFVLSTEDKQNITLPGASKDAKSVFSSFGEQNRSFTLNRQELADFRSIFHFIGQPCQLKKKSRFLVHTASNFSQTRNRIFKVLEKEKSINSVYFGHKLSCYGENFKDKYRIVNNNVKKKYQQNHLFPYLFCLSCQSKNYQYLQTYSNFFVPTIPNPEKTLLISSYKNQIKKNQLLNLYDSLIKKKFRTSTLFSCFENSSTISLKDLTNVLSICPSADYLIDSEATIVQSTNGLSDNWKIVGGEATIARSAVEKGEIEIPENLIVQKGGNNKLSDKNKNIGGEATIARSANALKEGAAHGSANYNIDSQNEFKAKNGLQLQNQNLPKHSDQVSDILGEIPLVLAPCKFRHRKKSSKFYHKKKKILQNRAVTFWKLKKRAELLKDKQLERFVDISLESKSREGLDVFASLPERLSPLTGVREMEQKQNFVFQEKLKKDLFTQNLKRNFLSKTLLELHNDSPPFLQDISLDSFLDSSKNQSSFRGLLIKRPFFVEIKSKFFKNDVDVSIFKNKETQNKKQKEGEQEYTNTLYKPTDFFLEKNLTLCEQFLMKEAESCCILQAKCTAPSSTPVKGEAFSTIAPQEKHQFIPVFDEKDRNFRKINLFENFVKQNFPPGWKARKQIKKILKTANILRNFRKVVISPIPSVEWSYLSKKPNKEDYLFSIYEISVQQALGYTCGEAILKLLSPINCHQLESGLKVVLWQINERISEVENQGFLLKSDIILLNSLRTKKSRTLRRLKIAKILRKTKILPKQMVFSVLPVLPPNLRPIIQLDENVVAVSDCSQIYQKIVQRSNRLSKKMSKYLSYETCLGLKVLLQQAVDGLIENGKGGSKPLCDNNGRPLKSLSDGLKGKKGRFRQDLLGRRVDYSGRSVIVVGPALKLHQCGLPKEMALELFQPFLIRQLFAKKIVSNIAVAKNYIKKETPIVLEILKQLLRSHPVLLNRAPTLHRLGVQAFQPKLVSGRAILLHPLVCSAFNADFDGDQMAVHIPLSSKARGEAWKILWSRNNILSPATGQPILVPSQDMVLGCYYLTTKKTNFITKKYLGAEKENRKKSTRTRVLSKLRTGFTYSDKPSQHVEVFAEQKGSTAIATKPISGVAQGLFFNNSYQVLKDLQQKRLKLHTSIWLKMDRNLEVHKEEQKPLEARINCCGNFTKIYPSYLRRFYKKEGLLFNTNKVKKGEDLYVHTTCGRVMLNQTISPTLHQPF